MEAWPANIANDDSNDNNNGGSGNDSGSGNDNSNDDSDSNGNLLSFLIGCRPARPAATTAIIIVSVAIVAFRFGYI